MGLGAPSGRAGTRRHGRRPREITGRCCGLQLELTESRVENRGLQALVDQLRERLGMADAHNQDLNRRLEEAHSTVDRVTLMLPAADETGRNWWKFW